MESLSQGAVKAVESTHGLVLQGIVKLGNFSLHCGHISLLEIEAIFLSLIINSHQKAFTIGTYHR